VAGTPLPRALAPATGRVRAPATGRVPVPATGRVRVPGRLPARGARGPGCPRAGGLEPLRQALGALPQARSGREPGRHQLRRQSCGPDQLCYPGCPLQSVDSLDLRERTETRVRVLTAGMPMEEVSPRNRGTPGARPAIPAGWIPPGWIPPGWEILGGPGQVFPVYRGQASRECHPRCAAGPHHRPEHHWPDGLRQGH